MMAGKKRFDSPEKWSGQGGAATTWWDGLDITERQQYKAHYEKVREWNAKRKFGQYPNMYDTTHIRIAQLSVKQVYRIWVFREHKID